MTIKHANTVVVADDGTSPVGTDEYNAAHTILLPGPMFHGHRTGTTPNRWYTTPTDAALTVVTPAVNTLYAVPFSPSRNVTADRIAVEVTTLGAGSEVRAGIYTDDGNCYPNALLVDSGILDSTTTGVKSATISQALSGGELYWLTILTKATAPILRGVNVVSTPGLLGWDSTIGAVAASWSWFVAQAYGALPGTYPAGGTAAASARAVPFLRLT